VSARGRRGLVWISLLLLASMVAGASLAQEPETRDICPEPFFHLSMGSSEGNWAGEAPGVEFDHHLERKVAVFNVAAGYRAAVTCVKMQNDQSYTVAPSGTVEGPRQITVTSTSAVEKRDILQVGFTSSEVPPPPQPLTPMVGCVSQVSNTEYRAHFGYQNPNQTATEVAVGENNGFSPAPSTAGSRKSSGPAQQPTRSV
jgi:hypothetical protein